MLKSNLLRTYEVCSVFAKQPIRWPRPAHVFMPEETDGVQDAGLVDRALGGPFDRALRPGRSCG